MVHSSYRTHNGAKYPPPKLQHTQGEGISSGAPHLYTGQESLSGLPIASNATTA